VSERFCLFRGGPADGKFLSVPKDKKVIHVMCPPYVMAFSPDPRGYFPPLLTRTARYDRESIAVYDDEREIIWCWYNFVFLDEEVGSV
jgi:type IV secretory pathway protease TraF